MVRDYDIGLGKSDFFLFVRGRKSAIASIRVDETNSKEEVERWAKAEYKKYKLGKVA